MKATSKVTAVFDHIVDFLAYSAGAVAIFMMLSTATEIFARSLLNISIQWIIEVNENFVLYITFLSAAWLQKSDWHIRVDVLVSRLNPRSQALLNTVTSFIGAALCLLIAYRAALTSFDLWQRGIFLPTVLELPSAPLIAIISIGSLLLSIQFIRKAYGYLASRRTLPEETKIQVDRGDL